METGGIKHQRYNYVVSMETGGIKHQRYNTVAWRLGELNTNVIIM